MNQLIGSASVINHLENDNNCCQTRPILPTNEAQARAFALDAERQMGRLLRESERAKGAKGNPRGRGAPIVRSRGDTTHSDAPTLEELATQKDGRPRRNKPLHLDDLLGDGARMKASRYKTAASRGVDGHGYKQRIQAVRPSNPTDIGATASFGRYGANTDEEYTSQSRKNVKTGLHQDCAPGLHDPLSCTRIMASIQPRVLGCPLRMQSERNGKMREFEPRVFGYACSSQYDDAPSAEVQTAKIEERARGLEAEFIRCHTEWEKGPEDPIRDRPEYQTLLGTLRRGDHLVVHDLTTLASKPRELSAAVKHLANGGIHLHTAAGKGSQFDLDPEGAEVVIKCWEAYEKAFATHVKATTRRALRAKKACGRVYHRRPSPGKKRITVKTVNGRTVRYDVWDEEQCVIIREIYRRKKAGESFDSIAKDFYARKLKRPDGRPWVTRPKWKRYLRVDAIKLAFRYYSDLLARGLELGHDGV